MWTWRCTTRLCNASVHTRASDTSIFDDASNIQHNHAASVRDSSFEMAKSTCKRKATEDVTCRPSKILRTDGHVNASVSITSTDLRSIRQTMYRSRRRTCQRCLHLLKISLKKFANSTFIQTRMKIFC